MESWLKVSLILCAFGFLKELRPSEPFITEYIIQYKNVSVDEVIHIAFPTSTYSSLISLPLIFLVTDALKYRPIVILEGLLYVLTWTLLLLGKDLLTIIFVEILYGVACSAEVAYYTYIYAQVETDNYTKVTSNTSSALYFGKFTGGLLAQILVTFFALSYHTLTWVTLSFSLLGFVVTLFLPPVKRSTYFHPDDKNLSGFPRAYSHFKEAYRQPHILKWSLWWALACAGQYQVVNYIQALWQQVNEDGPATPLPSYNGVVKAGHTLLAALLCFLVGYLRLDWGKWGEAVLGGVSLLQGTLLIWMGTTSYLYASYGAYTIFRTLHPIMLTIASAEVAQGIPRESFALIFGINMFMALILQTGLTLMVSDVHGLALPIRDQFLAYGGYFVTLGVLFCCIVPIARDRHCRKHNKVIVEESI